MTHVGSSVEAWEHQKVMTRIVCHPELTKLLVAPLIPGELENCGLGTVKEQTLALGLTGGENGGHSD